MTILLTFDNGYAPHASVVIESILEHCNSPLDFAVLYCELSYETIALMEKHYLQRENVNTIVFYKVDKTELVRFKNHKTLSHITNPDSALLRLFCSRIPTNEYVLYMDCDVIVCDNVCNVLRFADNRLVMGAVTEYDARYKTKYISKVNKLQFPPIIDPIIYEAYYYRAFKNLNMKIDAKYLCSGVLLINMPLWRTSMFGERCLDFIASNPEKCFAADQDALNYCCNGEYNELPPRWNSRIGYPFFTMYSDADYIDSYNNPAIIHMAGSIKPWHYKSGRTIRRLYIKYRRRTPWPEFTFQDKSLSWEILYSIKIVFKKILPVKLRCAIQRYCTSMDYYASARRE